MNITVHHVVVVVYSYTTVVRSSCTTLSSQDSSCSLTNFAAAYRAGLFLLFQVTHSELALFYFVNSSATIISSLLFLKNILFLYKICMVLLRYCIVEPVAYSLDNDVVHDIVYYSTYWSLYCCTSPHEPTFTRASNIRSRGGLECLKCLINHHRVVASNIEFKLSLNLKVCPCGSRMKK